MASPMQLLLLSVRKGDVSLNFPDNSINSLLNYYEMDTCIRRTPIVGPCAPFFSHVIVSKLYKPDTSLRRTVDGSPDGVHQGRIQKFLIRVVPVVFPKMWSTLYVEGDFLEVDCNSY